MKRACRLLLLGLLLSCMAQTTAEGRKVLSESGQAEFLARRTSGIIVGSFDAYCSLLYALRDVCIHTESDAINRTDLGSSSFAESYKATYKELFDAIARATKSSWKYDPKRDYWVFGGPALPLPFQIKLAAKWKADDRGNYVSYRPPVAPVGMDIYMLGSYSTDKKDEQAALFKKVRDELALRIGTNIKDALRLEDMEKVAIGKAEALYFKMLVPKTGIVWRQWVFVDSGTAFAIFSAIKPDQEAQVLPDVEAMVKSFTVTPANAPATQPGK